MGSILTSCFRSMMITNCDLGWPFPVPEVGLALAMGLPVEKAPGTPPRPRVPTRSENAKLGRKRLLC